MITQTPMSTNENYVQEQTPSDRESKKSLLQLLITQWQETGTYASHY